MIALRTGIAVLLVAICSLGAVAEEHGGRPNSPAQGAPGVLSLLPPDSVTEHAIDTPASKLSYTATAGTFALFDQSGERSAAIFYTAFVAKPGDKPGDKPDDKADPARPVTFVFNGGPGAGSAFLNLGLVGPRIAVFGNSGFDGAHVRLTDNPDTWLAFTDLVLIDPVGTGWSRAAKPDGGDAFWNIRRDAESLAKVIALYVAKNGRVSSPKFILGESYGGFRAAKVAQALQSSQGIIANGIVMVSPMIEGHLQFGGDRFALGAALALPSLAAAELERKGTFSPVALAQAEHFAMTDYLTTLAGPPPTGEAAHAFYGQVAQITGLPEDVIARERGFVRDAYVKNLRGADRKIVSHYDVTFATADPNPESASARGPDPILDGFIRAYGSAFVSYAHDELGFKTEMTYNLLASEVANKWDWEEGGHAPASAAEDLRQLLALTPSFRLLIAHGYSDLVTPYSNSRYVLNHIPPNVEGERADLKLYRGGHMFYTDPQSRKAFTNDARTMYASP
jgi:carboxypeptidase C (cathepsin A)